MELLSDNAPVAAATPAGILPFKVPGFNFPGVLVLFPFMSGLWRRCQLFTLLFATILALPSCANAQTPSYVGEWAYTAYIGGKGAYTPWLSSESAALAAGLADPGQRPDYCDFVVERVTMDWAETIYHGGTVEGYLTEAEKRFELSYKTSCTEPSVRLWTSGQLIKRRLVCPSYTRFMDNKCVPVTEIEWHASKGANMGPDCSKCDVGEPINPATGNMWHIEKDYAVAQPAGSALAIKRVYNSKPALKDGVPIRSFGVGWTHQYDSFLRQTAILPNFISIKCFRRNDTYEEFCEAPPYVTTNLPDGVVVTRGDGKSYVFHHMGTQWSGAADTNDRLSAVLDSSQSMVVSWVYVSANGDTTERFDANGLLLSITARNGSSQRLTYSTGQTNDTNVFRFPADAPVCAVVQPGATLPANRLLCVTDDAGRQLHFNYDEKGRVTAVTDPSGQTSTYEYDGPNSGCFPTNPTSKACAANNLTKVTYPDGKSRAYIYNESNRINGGNACSYQPPSVDGFGNMFNSMTGLIDENGVRHISWTYNCYANAVSSQLAGGVNKVELSYSIYANNWGTTSVSHTVGDPAAPQVTSASFVFLSTLGVSRNWRINTPCVECGSIASREYDVNGNEKSATKFDGSVTTYTYDLSRNLELTRVEASGTALSRMVSTTWHPVFRFPAQVAEPKRITTFTYDARGNLLTRSEQATSDLTGAAGFSATPVGVARTWTYTYTSTGKVASATGPRTDVVDVTTYEYDTSGNLVTVTNALGHVTTLSNYDVHGRAGQINSPNGTIMTLAYNVRGWLASRTVAHGGTSETTSYEYDGVGQVKKVTLPDQSFLLYTYDNAHRLTGVADNIGNRVNYTLDLTGNRTAETVTDASGTLTRKVARIFNTLNQATQVTGGTQ
jgi:YD repeat-containing protein